jgi:hypothetical protein
MQSTFLMTHDTPGTLGKISNNPAEQNHSSIVAHLGGALYEEPGSEIKKLLVRQRNLETQRQQQKSKYKYMMPAEIQNDPIINSDPELKKVKHTLDRKSFHMWRDEYFLSDKYCVEIDRDHNCRIFTHKEHPNSPRIVSASERCNCSIRKQYFIQ